MATKEVKMYSDFKSPFAYLAFEPGLALEKRYQVSLGARIERLRANGLVEVAGPRVRLAPSRLTVSNEVFVELLG